MIIGSWLIAMTSEIILSISLLILCGTVSLVIYINAKERKDLIRAVLAKNLTEVNTAEAIDKMPKEDPTPPDLTPLSEVDDDLFAKMVEKQNKN